MRGLTEEETGHVYGGTFGLLSWLFCGKGKHGHSYKKSSHKKSSHKRHSHKKSSHKKHC